jgi:curved DNA-binding protein CbpA
MNKHNLEILGLSEGATKDEINAAYDTLRAKYLEDRFLDGEAGNNAAKMLTKIETAHTELLNELSEESDSFTSAGDGGEAYDKVEQLIKEGNLQDAQRTLDDFNERPAKWHYLQSVVFYRKNWINESKKQLEIAMQLDSENEKYKEVYKKLNEKIEYDAKNHVNDGANQTVYDGQRVNTQNDDQMGGNLCSQCITCCYINMCVNCLCNMCCN